MIVSFIIERDGVYEDIRRRTPIAADARSEMVLRVSEVRIRRTFHHLCLSTWC